ncbi:hypothetical protein [Campylobacter helveticus]|uniref:Uncharacterized protein n=1 Tax=Campylobacter helveticus TaxID=28898 RepID=A0AAX2UJ80_9BACT|nr:hypothetical protein [Campylobacter helveticus]TNB56220.1 hypothetical protein FDW42_07780 [Campylobacter helveticus]TNB64807.1 hypothetical protein FDW43_01850 [Campylobacter helveticus]
MKNERYPREKAELIACKRDEVIKDLIALEVPFFSKDISEKKMEFDGKMEENYDFKRNFSFGEKLCFEVVAKAMNILKISMREVKLFNPDFKSKKKFYESFLRNLKFNFDKRQNFKKENQLELAKFILQNFKSALMKEQKQSYEVSNFEARELEETGVRSIFTSKKIQDSKYEWLYYTKWSEDSGLEEKFLGFIDERAHMIDEKIWRVDYP